MSDITGKVIRILPEQRFNGKNGEVVKNMFVIEHGGQYKKKAVFSVLGEDRWRQMNFAEGVDVQVSFDIDAREWNGKWFNELSAWRAVRIAEGQAQAPASPAPTPTPQPQAPQQPQPTTIFAEQAQGAGDDGLPF